METATEFNDNQIENQSDIPITGTGEISHEATLYAEPIAHIGSMPITNSLLTSWIAVLIIIIITFSIRLKLKKIPKGIQNFFEMVTVLFLLKFFLWLYQFSFLFL